MIIPWSLNYFLMDIPKQQLQLLQAVLLPPYMCCSTHTHVHTHAHIYPIHICIHAHTHITTHTYICPCTHIQAHICIHAHPHTLKHAWTCTHIPSFWFTLEGMVFLISMLSSLTWSLIVYNSWCIFSQRTNERKKIQHCVNH